MTAKATIVPHHRVDAALHGAAKAKAKADGVSLSQIAEAGLRDYTSNAGSTVRSKANSKVSAGKLTREAPQLPQDAADELARMNSVKDVRILPYLAALRDAGWSYASLAAPLRVTRQAIHLRLSAWERDVSTDPVTLPAVPLGPGRTTFPAHAPSVSGPRFDWAIWIDRGLYAVASENAKARNEVLRDVMERILDDYVSGRLVVTPVGGEDDV